MGLGPLRLVVLGDRPWVAVPVQREAALAAVRAWHAPNLKRRAVRRALQASVRAGVLPKVARTVDVEALPHMGQRVDILRSCAAALGAQHVTVSWPPQVERGRVYAQFLDRTGTSLGFLKIVPSRDLEDLRREVDALSHFDERPSTAFRTPRILASELSDTSDHWLLTEPVLSIDPHALRTDELRRLADSIGADTLRWCPRDALLDLPWWQELERQRDTFPRFFQDLSALVPDGLHVARVHGDFGAHNVLASPRGPVVIDWEYSSDTGPAGADYWFARAHLRPIAAVVAEARTAGRRDLVSLVAGVGYAASLDAGRARSIAQSWPPLEAGR